MNVYDFDKTIYDGDSTQDFICYCFRRKLTLLKYTPKQAKAFLAWKLGLKTKTEFKQELYQMFNGIDDIERWVRDFWASHTYKVKSFYLKQQRDDDIIISASPYFLLQPICQKLGIQYLIASEVNPQTGKYSGENCYGEEKVRRFEALGFKKEDIEAFYSDSYSDTPLAVLAQEAFLVKKDKLVDWDFNR